MFPTNIRFFYGMPRRGSFGAAAPPPVIKTSHFLDRCDQNRPFLIITCKFWGRYDHLNDETDGTETCQGTMVSQGAEKCRDLQHVRRVRGTKALQVTRKCGDRRQVRICSRLVITTSHFLDRCDQNRPFLIITCKFSGRYDHLDDEIGDTEAAKKRRKRAENYASKGRNGA